MGIFKAKIPSGPKEPVRPSIMVITPADPLPLEAPSENTPQAAPYPLIQAREGALIAMLEVLKPSPKRAVDIGNNALQRVSIGSPRLLTNGLFQFLQALCPWPTGAPFEMISKEVKSLPRCSHVHQPCLLRMYSESFLRHLSLHLSQRPFRLFPTTTQNDKIIRVAHHSVSGGRHRSIHRVQIDVGHQWADHGPLRGPFLRCPLRQAFHNPLLQERFQQPKHPPIPYMLLDLSQQWCMGNATETVLKIRIHNPYLFRLKKPIDLPQGILASALRSKPMTLRMESPLENGFQHKSNGGLYDSISHARDAQRSLVSAPGLLNVGPQNRSRLIASGAKLLVQLVQIPFQFSFKPFKSLMVRARSPFVRLNLKPCSSKCLGSVHLIDQTEPNASFHPLFKGLQHAIRPYRTFHPGPFPEPRLSCLLSPALAGHFRRSFFVTVGLHSSTFLHPFALQELPCFSATTGALTPARRALRAVSDNEHPPYIGQVSLLHMTRPSMHSVTKHLTRPATASPLPAQRGRLPGLLSRSGLRLESAGSSLRTAESCSSSSYGLHVRLGLLPTSPRSDAVTFGYQERASPGRGLSPLGSRLLAGARIPAFAGMTAFQENRSLWSL